MDRVKVNPELLKWARERAGKELETITKRFKKYQEWEKGGDIRPTYRQLERFAKFVNVPFGYLFLTEPPDEPLSIPDFRTVGNRPLRRPSIDLLDTVYLCLDRQYWYREHALFNGYGQIPFIGSATLDDNIVDTAAHMRDMLHFDLEERRRMTTWTDALSEFIDQSDKMGVLVMVSGIVESNTKRKLKPAEFRGFALADDLAPLVFVNGADTKAAQMFTLAHELAHLWLNQSALSNSSLDTTTDHEVERWCNNVAAELLVPLAMLKRDYKKTVKLIDSITELARGYKVSSLVIIRRMKDAGIISPRRFRKAYDDECKRLNSMSKPKGGSFYPTFVKRVGRRFAFELVASTMEGNTTYTDSFQLLGIKKSATFDNIAKKLGVGS